MSIDAPRSSPRWPYALLLAAAIVAAAALRYDVDAPDPARPSQQAERFGYDPLSEPEQDRARSVALADAGVRAALAGSTRTEVLLVERHQEDKADMRSGTWPRRADVLVYDYQRDRLVHAVVALADERVDAVETAEAVQPPLTADEGRRALDVALADPVAEAAIRAAWSAATGGAPFDAGAIQPMPWVFRSDSVSPGVFPGTEDCGGHRCAQLMLATRDGALIDAMPIVDLSTERVAHLGAAEEDA